MAVSGRSRDIVLRAKALRKQSLLQGLKTDELTRLAEVLETLRLPAGTSVFREGDPTEGIYMIGSGRVELTRRLDLDRKTRLLVMVRNLLSSEIRVTNGHWEHVLGSLEQGQFFGELSIIEGRETHGAEAVATAESELFLLRTQEFGALGEENPMIRARMLKNIARVTSGYVRRLDERIGDALLGA